jgi:hypothetical protein
MATGMKVAVFWDFVLCPDDGGRKFLLNIGQYLPYYMVQLPRRQPSS